MALFRKTPPMTEHVIPIGATEAEERLAEELAQVRAEAEFEKEKASLPSFNSHKRECPKCHGALKIMKHVQEAKPYIGKYVSSYGRPECIAWQCERCSYVLCTKPLDAE